MAEFWKPSALQIAKHIVLEGQVQGVGCRAQVQEWVDSIGHISGNVKNLRDGRVEIFVKGEDWRVERLVEILRLRMYPPVKIARVLEEELDLETAEINEGFRIFK